MTGHRRALGVVAATALLSAATIAMLGPSDAAPMPGASAAWGVVTSGPVVAPPARCRLPGRRPTAPPPPFSAPTAHRATSTAETVSAPEARPFALLAGTPRHATRTFEAVSAREAPPLVLPAPTARAATRMAATVSVPEAPSIAPPGPTAPSRSVPVPRGPSPAAALPAIVETPAQNLLVPAVALVPQTVSGALVLACLLALAALLLLLSADRLVGSRHRSRRR